MCVCVGGGGDLQNPSIDGDDNVDDDDEDDVGNDRRQKKMMMTNDLVSHSNLTA